MPLTMEQKYAIWGIGNAASSAAPTLEEQEQQALTASPTPQPAVDQPLPINEQPAEQTMTVAEAEPHLGIIGTAADVIKQVIGGAFKEAENVVQSGHDIADFVDNTVGDGTLIDDDKDYDFVPDWLKPQTQWGRTAQAISSFAWGWVAGGKIASMGLKAVSKALPAAAKLAKIAPNSEWARRAMKGAAVDFVTGDGTDERLADVLMDNEVFADSFLSYLASDPDDSFAEARLKNTIEGFLVGGVVDSFLPLMRGIKKVFKAGQSGGVEAAVKTRAEVAEQITKLADNAAKAADDTAKAASEAATAATSNAGKTVEQIAEEKIASVGGARTGMTLTKEAQAQAAREAIQADPRAVQEQLKANAKLKADANKALNTRHWTEAAQNIAEPFQNQLGAAAEERVMSMADEAEYALGFLLDNGFDKSLNKEKFFELRNSGGMENYRHATAAEVFYLNTFAPQHISIQLERVAEGIEGAVQSLRQTGEDLYDVLRDLKLSNQASGQAGKANDIVGYVGQVLEGGGARGAAKETAEQAAKPLARNGKELFSAMSDDEIVDFLTSVNTLIRNGDGASLKEMVDLLDKKAVEAVSSTSRLDRALSFRYFAMLSSVKTQLRNIIGNTTKIPLMFMEESVKGAVSGLRGQDGSIMGALAGAKNGMYYLQGIFAGRHQATENWLNSLKYNMAITRNASESAKAAANQVDWGKLNPIIYAPTKMLRAADEFFATLGGTAAAYENAMIELKRSGILKGVSKAEQKAITEKWMKDSLAQAFGTVTTNKGNTIRGTLRFKESVAMADELTFQQDLGQFSQSLYNLVNSCPPLKLIFPFVKTPANIFKDVMWTRGINMPREVMAAFKEGATPEQQAQAAAHFASAAAIWLGAYGLYSAGWLTGNGPDGQMQQEAKRATGWRPNSFKAAGHYVTLDAVEPFGTALGTFASYMERIEKAKADGDEIGAETIGAEALNAVLDTVQNKTFLRGLASIFQDIRRGSAFDGYGVVGQFASSFVPSIVRDLGYAWDPVRRETPDVWSKMVERTPFRTSLVPRVSWLTGQDMETGNGAIGAFVNGLNLSAEEESATMYELSRLSGVSDPSKKIMGDYELTPEEYAEYKRTIGNVQLGGRTLYQALADLINSDLYRRHAEQYPDPSENEIEATRAEMLKNVIKAYKDAGKQRFLQQNPQIRAKALQTPIFAGITNW